MPRQAHRADVAWRLERSVTRPPATYVTGLDGPAVVAPGRIAAVLVQKGLGNVRYAMRGMDPEVDAVLEAIVLAAEAWKRHRGIAFDLERPDDGEGPGQAASVVTATEAAGLLGITPQAVRLAIREGRLAGRPSAGVWLIDREAVELYRTARTNGGPQ